MKLKEEESLEEESLLKAARNGDKNAFKEFIIKYEHKVAKTVIGMLGRCPEAEDIGQETFISFYRSLDRFRGESSIGTYLTRIAINLSLNELKRRKRRERFFFFKQGYQTRGEIFDNLDKIPDKADPGYRVEINDFVREGIRKLEPKFRAVVVLRLLDGYTTAETAEILKLPIGTVLSRLNRAQDKLKEIFKPIFGGKI